MGATWAMWAAAALLAVSAPSCVTSFFGRPPRMPTFLTSPAPTIGARWMHEVGAMKTTEPPHHMFPMSTKPSRPITSLKTTSITKVTAVRKWTVITNGTSPPHTNVTEKPQPTFLATAPKLDRAHKNKLLVEAPCGQQCSAVVWEIKVAGESTWRRADAEPHSNFPDTFYIRSLLADTAYVLRALLRLGHMLPYGGEDVPTLEARTCPEKPPPVSNLHAHAAGPGWLEVRWTPPLKENCKSHLYYQARYAPHGSYFSAWRQYGFFRNDRWVHFRPTHPCAVWPGEFCMLVTDAVRPGEQHVVEVRVSRFDELTQAVSDSRKVAVRADTACVATDTCGVIGAAAAVAPTAAPNGTTAFDVVDVDDADADANATADATASTDPANNQTHDVAAHRAGASGYSSFGRLAPVFLALLIITCIALPAAYIWGKRRGAREAVDLHMAPGWKRRFGGGGSEPVLEEDADDDAAAPSCSALQVDQHGRYSWAKLLPRDA